MGLKGISTNILVNNCEVWLVAKGVLGQEWNFLSLGFLGKNLLF